MMRKVWLYLLVVKESSFADDTFPPCRKLELHLTKLLVRICLPTFIQTICLVFEINVFLQSDSLPAKFLNSSFKQVLLLFFLCMLYFILLQFLQFLTCFYTLPIYMLILLTFYTFCCLLREKRIHLRETLPITRRNIHQREKTNICP